MELGALINDLYKHARVMDKYHYNVSFSFNPDHSNGGHLFSASQGVSDANQPVGSQQSNKNDSDRDSTAYVLIEPTLTRPEDYIAICTEPPTKKLRINDSYYVQSPIPAPVLKSLKRPRNVVVCDPLDALYDETGLRHDESGNVVLKTSIFGPTTVTTSANDRSTISSGSSLRTKSNPPPLSPQSLPSASLAEETSTRKSETEDCLMPSPPPPSLPSASILPQSLDTTVPLISTTTTTTNTASSSSSSSTIIATTLDEQHQQTSSSTIVSSPPPPPPPPPPFSNSLLPEFSGSTVSLPNNDDDSAGRNEVINTVYSNTLPRRAAGLEIATNEQMLFDELKSFKFDKSTKRRINQLPPKEPNAQDSRSLMMENIKRFDKGSLRSVNQPASSKSKTETSSAYDEPNSLQSMFNKALINRRSAIIDDDDEEEEEKVSEIIFSDNDTDEWD